MIRSTSYLVTASVLALLTRSSGVAAQSPENRPRDHARTFLVVRLAEALDLSDEKALQMSAIIRKSDEQRHQLRQQRKEAEAKLREALAKTPVDQAALTKLVADANGFDQQLALLPEQSFKEAQQILTVEQQAKLILVRPELQAQVRRAIRRRFEPGADPPRPAPQPQAP
ncbi:MAG TPA: hypothetical protein VL403_05730 [Candidatus Kryptonia bacterium]|nr:hypothetical protein [Candidatus Kryptonia bacterium]